MDRGKVKEGPVKPPRYPPEGPGKDIYRTLSEGDNTWGSIQILGRAKIVCLGNVAEYLKYFKNWDNCPKPVVGNLSSTTVTPIGWTDNNTLKHDYRIEWNCCCGCMCPVLTTSLTWFQQCK